MIADLKPYPATKDSGVPWLGKVPEHWKDLRARYLFREIDRRSQAGAETHLSMSQALGLVPRSMVEQGTLVSESYAGGKLCGEGDLVLNRLKAHLGVFAMAKQTGVVSPDYTVLRGIRPMVVQYFEHVLRSPACRHELRVRAKGIVEGFWRLYTDDFHEIRLPVPPIDEQSAIVRFLNHVDRLVWRHIRAKQKLVKLLEEQRQAIIHRAVTRGLDPNVCLKPSGVEWLGEVPQHWSIARLKVIATEVVDCLHATPVYSEGGPYPAIRTADVQPGQLLLDQACRVDERHYREWTARMVPLEGDILYTREGERFGIAALVPPDTKLCISQRMMAFRIDPKHNSAYVMWQINCQHVYSQAAADLIGAAAPHVNVERIRNFWLALPPRSEQDQIVSAVEETNEVPLAAIRRAREEISLLREYRTRLIADVVTGKLDVREAATTLPDEADELEAVYEAEEVAHEEEDQGDELEALEDLRQAAHAEADK